MCDLRKCILLSYKEKQHAGKKKVVSPYVQLSRIPNDTSDQGPSFTCTLDSQPSLR